MGLSKHLLNDMKNYHRFLHQWGSNRHTSIHVSSSTVFDGVAAQDGEADQYIKINERDKMREILMPGKSGGFACYSPYS